jgi:hypothetical protein
MHISGTPHQILLGGYQTIDSTHPSQFADNWNDWVNDTYQCTAPLKGDPNCCRHGLPWVVLDLANHEYRPSVGPRRSSIAPGVPWRALEGARRERPSRRWSIDRSVRRRALSEQTIGRFSEHAGGALRVRAAHGRHPPLLHPAAASSLGLQERTPWGLHLPCCRLRTRRRRLQNVRADAEDAAARETSRPNCARAGSIVEAGLGMSEDAKICGTTGYLFAARKY